ncbi:FitA-like ribbon-helix-helix domain-containing protein [Ponticaulis profundi]|uniref:Arc family DNA-binding protein n=1 Tax=Ponticaulis profundi TaxID=2665222 RepID=A0ABW1S5R4_9PROT
MATLTIRNLDDEVRDRLREQAARHGRSMEAEARSILLESVNKRPRRVEDALIVMRKVFEEAGFADDLDIEKRESARPSVDFEA